MPLENLPNSFIQRAYFLATDKLAQLAGNEFCLMFPWFILFDLFLPYNQK